MKPERPRGALPVLFSIVVVDLIGFGIVIPILPFYARSFGASATVLGVLLAGYAAMQFVFAPIWGRLSDRIGRRPVMLVTVAATSLALFALAFADSLFWLFAARLLAGIFGANVSVASAYVIDVTNEDERTRFMGMIGASFGVGFLLGPAIGGLLAPYGYHVPMLVAAGMAAVNFVYAMFVLREPANHQRDETAGVGRLEVLRDGFVRKLCSTYFIFSFAVTQLETVFVFFMMDRFGYDAPKVALILVMMAVIMAGIQGGGMRALAARFGEKSLIVAGVLIIAVAFAAIPWIWSVPLLLLPLALSAVGRAVSQPSMMGLVSIGARPNTRGSVMGTFQSSASLARVLGPVTAGLLYDVWVGAPFILASVLMLVALGIAASQSQPSGLRDAEASPR